MTEQEERLARERAEIAARVASFRETQQKFEREREEYYATTMGKAWADLSACIPDVKRRRNREKFVTARNEAAALKFSSQVQQPCER